MCLYGFVSLLLFGVLMCWLYDFACVRVLDGVLESMLLFVLSSFHIRHFTNCIKLRTTHTSPTIKR